MSQGDRLLSHRPSGIRMRPQGVPCAGHAAEDIPRTLTAYVIGPGLATDTYPSVALFIIQATACSSMWLLPPPMSPPGYGAAGGEGSEQCAPGPEPRGCHASGSGVCGHGCTPDRSVMGQEMRGQGRGHGHPHVCPRRKGHPTHWEPVHSLQHKGQRHSAALWGHSRTRAGVGFIPKPGLPQKSPVPPPQSTLLAYHVLRPVQLVPA